MPPIQMGMGRCTGKGFSPASGMRCHLPWKVTNSFCQSAQDLDLFLHAAAPIVEVLAQRLVFHLVPADADAQA
jgi:hypothetical protein